MQLSGLFYGAPLLKLVDCPCTEVLGPDAALFSALIGQLPGGAKDKVRAKPERGTFRKLARQDSGKERAQ